MGTAALILITSVAGNLHTTTAATSAGTTAVTQSQHSAQTMGTTALAARLDARSVEVASPGSTGHFDVQLAPSQAITLYLPLVMRSYPLRSIFGMETTSLNDAGSLPQIASAGATVVRRNALIWSDVEANLGERNWAAVAGLETELDNAVKNNFQTILIVRGTPVWAQAVAGSACGPVKPEQYGAFGAFLRDVAIRYAGRVSYLEIGNEPDVATSPSNDPFGCWGNPTDPNYFGGEAYGKMLIQAYPQIKAANPHIQVLIGGLLLDCDPRNPPNGKNCTPAKFLEGILKAGAANFFDGVSFHAYDFSSLTEALGYYSNSSWASAWNTTGPVVTAKARFIKEVLNANGALNKILINTETALICYACTGKGDAFEESKAYYVPEAYAAAMAEGLRAQVWYSWQGWNNSGLNDPAYPKALQAYTVATRKLSEAAFLREVPGLTGVKAYEFLKGTRKLWVAWSLDGAAHTIALPTPSVLVEDVYGAAQPTGSSAAITLKPVYIEMP